MPCSCLGPHRHNNPAKRQAAASPFGVLKTPPLLCRAFPSETVLPATRCRAAVCCVVCGGEMREVLIRAGEIAVRARLLDTPTAERIWAALPIVASARTWGAELYFEAAVTSERESDARETVKVGEIAFWPEGDAIAIGFGPTPLSRTKAEIRFAGPCNIWAEALDDVRQFKSVHAGEPITISESLR